MASFAALVPVLDREKKPRKGIDTVLATRVRLGIPRHLIRGTAPAVFLQNKNTPAFCTAQPERAASVLFPFVLHSEEYNESTSSTTPAKHTTTYLVPEAEIRIREYSSTVTVTETGAPMSEVR